MKNECTSCKSENIIHVQYGIVADKENPCHYDGISEIECRNCGYREGRWSGKELKSGEHEPVHGETHRRDCPFYVRKEKHANK